MVEAQRMPTMAESPTRPAWALEKPYGGKASKAAIEPQNTFNAPNTRAPLIADWRRVGYCLARPHRDLSKAPYASLLVEIDTGMRVRIARNSTTSNAAAIANMPRQPSQPLTTPLTVLASKPPADKPLT